MSQTKKEWTEDDAAKFFLKMFAIYLLGALMTNSYCQVYRYDDWRKESHDPTDAGWKLSGATIGWPVYAMSKLSMDFLRSLQCKPVPEVESNGLIKLE